MNEMSYNLVEAFIKALNVLQQERKQVENEYLADEENEVKKERYLTYKSILERLDSLV